MKTKTFNKRLHVASAALFLFVFLPITAGCNGKKDVGSTADKPQQTQPAKASSASLSSDTAEMKALGFMPFSSPIDVQPFTVEGLDGGSFDTKDLKGKVSILNFWGPWCPPCKQELPHIEKFYAHFRDNKDFQLVAVSIREEREVVKNFVSDNGYTFPIYLDERVTIVQPYVAQGVPATYLVNKEGKIIGGYLGPYDFSSPQFISFIERLIK